MPNSGTASCPPAMYRRSACVDVPGCLCIPDPPCVFHSRCVKRHEYSTPYVSHYLLVPRPGSYTPYCDHPRVFYSLHIPLHVVHFLCILLLLDSTHCVFHFLLFPIFHPLCHSQNACGLLGTEFGSVTANYVAGVRHRLLRTAARPVRIENKKRLLYRRS